MLGRRRSHLSSFAFASTILSLGVLAGCGGSDEENGGLPVPGENDFVAVTLESASTVSTSPIEIVNASIAGSGPITIIGSNSPVSRRIIVTLPAGSTGAVPIGTTTRVTYEQTAGGLSRWVATGGTVQVTSLTTGAFQVSLAGVSFVPDASEPSGATGSFGLSGTIRGPKGTTTP